MTQSTEELAEEFQPGFRSKRRATKVDYTEKKEDFDFEVTKQPSNRKTEMSPTKDPANPKKKRKNNNGSRSESPLSSLDYDLDTSSSVPLNYQPDVKDWMFSNILNLEGAVIKNRLELVLKNGNSIKKNDNVYMICEPPGEPYYIGRVMGFVDKDKVKHQDTQQIQHTKTKFDVEEPASNFSFKINWWYRSRDISKHSTDSRLVYASMHSDVCPIQSFRGTCVVKHKDEIEDLESYKSKPNHFWFDKFFDRYMIKFYDVLPTSLLTSLPINYRTALNKRFQYIFLEQGKAKDMLQEPKSCVKCHQWSSSSDSVECCECGDIYHMLCLDPPLFKKPARGFAWSCLKCSKTLESKKLIPSDQLQKKLVATEELDTNIINPLSPINETKRIPLYEELAIQFLQKDQNLTFQQRRNSEEWIYRYLGMHAALEDALDLQDRPYPRAASRLGPKNQLTGVQLDWFDHPVIYYDDSELAENFQNRTQYHGPSGRKRKIDGRKKKGKSDDVENQMLLPLKVPTDFEDVDPDEFPPWLQRRPKGYIERGGDDGRTSELLWVNPSSLADAKTPEEVNKKLDEYFTLCNPIAERIGLIPTTPNFQDKIIKNLMDSQYDIDKAMELNQILTKTDLKEPQLTKIEIKKFEDGVRKYGSELWPTYKEVKSQTFGMIVRFYYLWKKTASGRNIWGNYADRRKFKSSSKVEENKDKQGDIANDHDDSSYDMGKVYGRTIHCKHCKTVSTKQWFRCPGQQHPDDHKDIQYALCLRCARLWRRYAVIWEDPGEVQKKTSQKGSNGWKRKVEHELVVDAELILKARQDAIILTPESSVSKKPSTEPRIVEVENGTSKIPSALKEEAPQGSTKTKKTNIKVPGVSSPSFSLILTDNTTKTHVNGSDDLLIRSKAHPNQQSAINETYHFANSAKHNSRPKFSQASKNTAHPHSLQSLSTQNITKSCSICFYKNEETEEDYLLKCQRCNLRVHLRCYGIDFNETITDNLADGKVSLKDYRWCCDSCSNELHPLISRNYTCVVCNEDGFKAPLKRTLEGKWAHLLCSFFSKNVKFLDAKALQPIIGAGKLNLDHIEPVNNVIDSFKCDECSTILNYGDIVKTGSAQFGFRLTEVSKDSKEFLNSVKVSGKNVIIKPVLICTEHQEVKDFHPSWAIEAIGKSRVSSVLDIFLEKVKKTDKSNVSGIAMRYREFQKVKLTESGDSTKDSSIRLNGDQNECSTCGTKITVAWLADGCCFNCSSLTAYARCESDGIEIKQMIPTGIKYQYQNSENKPVFANSIRKYDFKFEESKRLSSEGDYERWSKEFNPFKVSINNQLVANSVTKQEQYTPIEEKVSTQASITSENNSSTSELPSFKEETVNIPLTLISDREELRPLLLLDKEGDVVMEETADKVKIEEEPRKKMSIGNILV